MTDACRCRSRLQSKNLPAETLSVGLSAHSTNRNLPSSPIVRPNDPWKALASRDLREAALVCPFGVATADHITRNHYRASAIPTNPADLRYTSLGLWHLVAIDRPPVVVAVPNCAHCCGPAVLGSNPVPPIVVRTQTRCKLAVGLRTPRPSRQLPAHRSTPADPVLGFLGCGWNLPLVRRLLAVGLRLEESRSLCLAGRNLPSVLGIDQRSVRERSGLSSSNRGTQPGATCDCTTQGSQTPDVGGDIGFLSRKGFHASRPRVFENSVVFSFVRTQHELLVDCFFYPTFFRYCKSHRRLRLFVATFAAACFGNAFYHFFRNLNYIKELGFWKALAGFDAYIFYSVVLAAGIAISQLRQRPVKTTSWIRGRFVPTFCVISFFCILSVFGATDKRYPIQACFRFLAHLFNLAS